MGSAVQKVQPTGASKKNGEKKSNVRKVKKPKMGYHKQAGEGGTPCRSTEGRRGKKLGDRGKKNATRGCSKVGAGSHEDVRRRT